MGCRPNLPEGFHPSDSHLRFAPASMLFPLPGKTVDHVFHRVHHVMRVRYAERRIHRQRNLVARERLRLGEIARLIAETLHIRAHQVQRQEMHAHAYIARLELLDERVAVNRKRLRTDAQHVQMTRMVTVRRRLLQLQLRHL